MCCPVATPLQGRVPPVGFAIIYRQERIIRFLLEVEGYDKSIYGLRVPIDIAVRAGNYAAAKILLDARGGAVSIMCAKICKFMIISIICYSTSFVPFH